MAWSGHGADVTSQEYLPQGSLHLGCSGPKTSRRGVQLPRFGRRGRPRRSIDGGAQGSPRSLVRWISHVIALRGYLASSVRTGARMGGHLYKCRLQPTPRRLPGLMPKPPGERTVGYLVLLLCTSANLGSGVSGGRCGLTTSLNQASC